MAGLNLLQAPLHNSELPALSHITFWTGLGQHEVPEPGACVLMMLGGVLIVPRRR
jgi:hypothetical protein